MFTYCLTFRIANKTIGNKSYEDRRKQLLNNIYDRDAGFWDEPTSFILVTSGLGISDFTKRASRGLSAADDLLLAFDLSDNSAAYFGALRHEDVLESFFPLLRRVP